MKKIIYLVIFLAFTLFSYKYFQSHIFTIHFVDEDENIIAGYYMGKGEKLYKDIFSHKQPLPAVISMYEQKIQKPNSLYLLIKRHREIVYFYSITWTIILIIVFGLPGLLFGILFEIVKQFQLGNMFLSESLVVFPLIYSLGFLWKMFAPSCHSREGGNPDATCHSGESRNLYNKLFHRFRIKTGMIQFIETLLFSFSLSLILFLQFTLIPYIFIVLIILFISKKVTVKQLFTFYFLLFTFLFIFCYPFVDYAYYFDNTVNAVRSIYLGGSAADNPWNMFYYSFLRPFAVILEMEKSEFGTLTGILSIGYMTSFIYLFFIQNKLIVTQCHSERSEYPRRISIIHKILRGIYTERSECTQDDINFIISDKLKKLLITTYFLLGLCSLRIVYPDKTIYSGFHGLPWLGAFLFITIYQISLVIASARSKRSLPRTAWCWGNLFVYLTCFLFPVSCFYYGKFLIKDYYRPSNRETDWYVNYSRFYDFGQTIRILSTKEDKLMVLPAEQLIYWQSGLPHASRFLYIYPFVIPRYKKELYDYWEKTPPAFIYDEQNLNLFQKWWPQYTRVKNNGNDTPLFIRKDKINKLKKWQNNEIKRLNFTIEK